MGFFTRKKDRKKREHVADQRRAFSAAANSNLLNSWLTESKKLDADLKAGLRALRARAREASQNNDYARRYLQLLEDNVVGRAGIRLQNKAKDGDTLDVAANRKIEDAWAQWGRKGGCDVTGKYSWVDCQNMFIATVARDGEALIRKVYDKRSPFGFLLQFIEVDALDENHNQETRGGNVVKMGIELDQYERPVAYWLRVNRASEDTYFTAGAHRVRIPAEQIIHAFRPERPHQTRGYSWMASALVHMHHLNVFEEAAIVAGRIGASSMGFYKEDVPDGYTGDDTSSGDLINEVEPGMFRKLPPGVSVETFDGKYPNEVFDPFVKRALKGISSGLGVSYCSLASDLEAVNYSSIRSGTIEDRDHYRGIQNWTAASLHDQVFPDWLRMAMLTQAVSLPASKFDKFNAATWQPRGWQWVDPQKDLMALKGADEMQITSLTHIVADQGRDLEEILQQRQQDNALLKKYGLLQEVISDG